MDVGRENALHIVGVGGKASAFFAVGFALQKGRGFSGVGAKMRCVVLCGLGLALAESTTQSHFSHYKSRSAILLREGWKPEGRRPRTALQCSLRNCWAGGGSCFADSLTTVKGWHSALGQWTRPNMF